MEQCIYDELIQFCLETISSEEYLNDIGIPRFKSVNWNSFKNKVKNQTVEPGIYPRGFGKTVHYYAVRNEEDDIKKVANGYPNKGGLDPEYAIGLDVQKDHSHGLCQTFALIFYQRQEDKLLKGKENYFSNVLIGLNFLKDFVKEDENNRERIWSIKSIIENITKLHCKEDFTDKDRIKVYKSIKGKKNKKIKLSQILSYVLSNSDKLNKWYEG
jgi:hypothetical protein